MGNSNMFLEGPRFELKLGEEGYPELLSQVPDPPELLYGIGNPGVLLPGIAVIGARKATPYGLAAAKRFARHAAKRGVPIISGGARGCDQEAHRAALAIGAPTVVVFGSGADVPYPASGRRLFQEVLDKGGAIVSENPWGSPALPHTFLLRNRIIAGLAMLLVIAEAGLPSGTFSTADAALEANRVVATVPGSITSPNSRGANHLIVQGAHPVIDESSLDAAIDDAFMHLPLSVMEPPRAEGSVKSWERMVKADPLLSALASEAYTPGELTAYFDFSAAELHQRLAHYEMRGLVERGRDGRYQAVLGTF
ncbi:MAG: DNA-processing protein DprA [Coriobacteriales bacterium]